MTTTEPPGAPSPPPTDRETVRAAVARINDTLHDPANTDPPGQVIGDAILGAIFAERERIVSFVQGKAEDAARAHDEFARTGQPQAAQARLVAGLLAGLAERLSQPPGEECVTCHGARVVPSTIVTAGGARRPLPCPACAAASPPAARPGLALVPEGG